MPALSSEQLPAGVATPPRLRTPVGSRASSPSPSRGATTGGSHELGPRTLDPTRRGERPRSTVSTAATGDYGLDPAGAAEGGGEPGTRRRRQKGRTETFIFVRPPPSSRTPLAIQCQLVAPTAAAGRTPSEFSVSSRRASAVLTTLLTASPSQSTTSLHDPTLGTDSDIGGGEGPSEGHQLSRTVSMRSTASGVSASGSVASSSATTSGITKRIVPLWNLDFHTMMTTCITDAGTDAKLVKFLKRGIAVYRVGFLEPIESWQPIYNLNNASSPSVLPSPSSLRDTLALPSFSSDAISPSRLSLDNVFSRSSRDEGPRAVIGGNSSAAPVDTEPRKPFGRFFGGSKKKDSISDFSFFRPSGSLGSLFGGNSNKDTAATSSAERSPWPPKKNGSSHPPSVVVQQPPSGGGPAKPQLYLGPPTFGTSPMVRPLPGNEKKSSLQRPNAYIWIVAKWAKDDDGWSFAGITDAFNSVVGGNDSSSAASSSSTSTGGAVDQYRFEWIRGRNKQQQPSRSAQPVQRTSGQQAGSMPPQSDSLAPTTTPTGNGFAKGGARSYPSPSASRTSLAHSSVASPRPSYESRREVLADVDNGGGNGSSAAATGDEAEDEDPEDSETPWMCYVVRVSTGGANATSSGVSSSERVLIGTLSPAPHHPKVVAQLKTPYPLAPFPLPGVKEMNSLSPEQLKDVLCATAMFLLMREEWGGLGKSKKSDAKNGKR